MYEKEKKRYFQEKAAAWLNSEGEDLSDITGQNSDEVSSV